MPAGIPSIRDQILASDPTIVQRIKLYSNPRSLENLTGCWIFTGKGGLKANSAPYGMIQVKNLRQKSSYVHRLAYVLQWGAVGHLHAMHLCHVKRCWNPAHLAQGTEDDNAKEEQWFRDNVPPVAQVLGGYIGRPFDPHPCLEMPHHNENYRNFVRFAHVMDADDQ